MTRYEHTQIGHVIIWFLFAIIIIASGVAGLSHREMPLVASIILLASLVLLMATGSKREVLEDANYVHYGFATLSSIFSYLETYPYGKHQLLKAFCEPFFRERERGPSQLLRRTARLAADPRR